MKLSSPFVVGLATGSLISLVLMALVLVAYSAGARTNRQHPSPAMQHQKGMCAEGGCGQHAAHQAVSITSEQSFLEHMIPHHQEAVESSTLLLDKGSDPALQAFAQAVITAQSAEIEQMTGWLSAWFDTSETGTGHYSRMMTGLENLTGASLDERYVQGMIVHHQAAVDSAKALLELSPRQELQSLADAIISTQTTEISWLQDWLSEREGSTTTR